MAAVGRFAFMHDYSEELGYGTFVHTICSASFLRLGRQERLQV